MQQITDFLLIGPMFHFLQSTWIILVFLYTFRITTYHSSHHSNTCITQAISIYLQFIMQLVNNLLIYYFIVIYLHYEYWVFTTLTRNSGISSYTIL